MLTIQKTTDYSQFRYFSSNRPISEKSIPKALLESIRDRDLLESHPILVTKDMYVLDGQHRLEVAKILDRPIYYVIDKRGDEQDIPRLQIQKKWDIKNYLNYYRRVKDDYQFVHDIVEEFGYSLHLPFVVDNCANGKNATDSFRRGVFEIKKDKSKLKKLFKQVSEIKDAIKKHVPIGASSPVTSEVYKAIWKLINTNGYNHDTMLVKIERYPENAVLSCNFKKRDAVLESLKIRVYNFFNKKADQLDIDV